MSAPVARPAGSGVRYRVANQSAGAPTTPRTKRKKPLVASTPSRGSNALVKLRPELLARHEHGEPGDPDEGDACGLCDEPCHERPDGARQRASRPHHDEPRGEKRSGHEGSTLPRPAVRETACLRVVLREDSAVADGELAYLTPEAKARVAIDRQLDAAGWVVQDARAVNLSAAQGVAVREFVMKAPHGRADYLLFVDGGAVGVIEAKKEGTTLTGVEWQTAKYVDGAPGRGADRRSRARCRSSTSRPATETRFTNGLDPDAGEPRGLLVPPARDARRLARADPRAPDGADAPPPAARSAARSTRRASGRRRSRRSGTSSSRSPRTARAR